MRALPLLLALAACAAPQPQAGPGAFEEAIAGRSAGAPESCVPVESQQPIRILDARTVAVERGRTLWISRLEEPCPDLEPTSRLVVEVSAGGYCRNDLFRVLSPGTTIPGPACRFAAFTPYRKGR